MYANTADHLLPIVDGGTHDVTNLVACCTTCNSRRSMERNNAHRKANAAAFVAARGASRPSYLRTLRASGPTGALADSPPTGTTDTNATPHTPTEGA